MSELSQPHLGSRPNPAFNLCLEGTVRAIAISAWVIITLLSLLSLALSVYSVNLWDRFPASKAPVYFQNMTSQDVQSHTDYQNAVLQSGLSLSGYAYIFTAARILGGLALLLVGFLLLWRYNDNLMAVLMAVFLSAAAGIWDNTLIGWGVALAPWMAYPASLLAWLLWCGVIVLYTFRTGDLRRAGRSGWQYWLSLFLS
jgi:hypothetical protein